MQPGHDRSDRRRPRSRISDVNAEHRAHAVLDVHGARLRRRLHSGEIPRCSSVGQHHCHSPALSSALCSDVTYPSDVYVAPETVSICALLAASASELSCGMAYELISWSRGSFAG